MGKTPPMQFYEVDNCRCPFVTALEVIEFYEVAIAYRSSHKNESETIARYVFDCTFSFVEKSSRLAWGQEVIKLRYEFGALEAPGRPPEESTDNDDEYVDRLWLRLTKLVTTLKEKVKQRAVGALA